MFEFKLVGLVQDPNKRLSSNDWHPWPKLDGPLAELLLYWADLVRIEMGFDKENPVDSYG